MVPDLEPVPAIGDTQAVKRRRNFAAMGCALSTLFVAGGGWWFLVDLQTQARIASGGNDITEADLISEMYARDNETLFPPLSAVPGKLMFDADVMYPRYCRNAGSVTAEFDTSAPMNQSAMWNLRDTKHYIDDHSYFYLGYIVSNETELLAFAKAYREYALRGEKLPDAISVAKGNGSLGSNVLLRLREPKRAVNALEALGVPTAGLRERVARVPVFIERPGHYRRDGGWVAFLDPAITGGRADFLRYPGEFPMTRACIDALTSLDSLESGTRTSRDGADGEQKQQ